MVSYCTAFVHHHFGAEASTNSTPRRVDPVVLRRATPSHVQPFHTRRAFLPDRFAQKRGRVELARLRALSLPKRCNSLRCPLRSGAPFRAPSPELEHPPTAALYLNMVWLQRAYVVGSFFVHALPSSRERRLEPSCLRRAARTGELLVELRFVYVCVCSGIMGATGYDRVCGVLRCFEEGAERSV